MNKKTLLSNIVVVSLLGFIGCGGGSSTATVTTTETQKISGNAVDDLILNGIVIAKTVTGTELATERTSSTDGSYVLNVAHTGIVLLNVTCDSDSLMLNPETNVTVACGDDIELNSMASVEEGVDTTAYISPLTEIVYQRALSEAGSIDEITDENFEEARTEIGVMFGIDPIADNPIEGSSADIIAAIHTLADQDENSSVIDVTNALAEQLADGAADGATDETVADLVEVMDDANLTNNLVDTNGTFTPDENLSGLSDVAETKALFTELRTQAMSVIDYKESSTPGFLDTEADSMNVAINDVTMNIGFIGDMLSKLMDGIEEAEENNLSLIEDSPIGESRFATLTKVSIGSWTYVISQTDSESTWEGSVTYPEIDEDTFSPYTFTALTAEINGTVPLDYEPVTDDGVVDSQSFNGSLTVTKTAEGANIVLSGHVASNGTEITLSAVKAEVGYEEDSEEDDIVFNYFKLNELTVQGVVDQYTIDGSLIVNSYVQNSGLADKGGIDEQIESAFKIKVSCSEGLLDESFQDVSFTFNGTTYYEVGSTFISDAHYIRFHGMPTGTLSSADITTNIQTNHVCQTSDATVNIEILDIHDHYEEKIYNSGWLPNDVTFTGKIARTDVLIEGTINAKWLNAESMDLEDDNETVLVDITMSGKLKMPERPEMLTTLTFTNTATENTIGASYTYDSTVINMSALFDNEMENGDINITTHTGLLVDIEVTDGELIVDGTGTVKKDGKLIGTLEERSNVPVIKYIDGSFESLP